jgi:hypothetical protein
MLKRKIFYLLSAFLISGCLQAEYRRPQFYSMQELESIFLVAPTDTDEELDVTIEDLGNVVAARIELKYGLEDLLANLTNRDGNFEPYFHWITRLDFPVPLEIVSHKPIINPTGTRGLAEMHFWRGDIVIYEVHRRYTDELNGVAIFQVRKSANAMVISILAQKSFGSWLWISENTAKALMTRFFNEEMSPYPDSDRLYGAYGETIVYYYE